MTNQKARRAAGLAVLAIAVAPAAALAQKTWNNTITAGAWSVPGNWLENATPTAADNVAIAASDLVDREVSLDITATILDLNLGNTGTGTHTLSQDSNIDLNARSETIGYGDGAHAAYVQSAGNNNAAELHIGDALNSIGSYDLSGSGTLTVSDSSGISIADAGSGTFSQSGGVNHTQYLFAGATSGFGTYNLSAGTLIVDHEEYFYNGGFTQSGGSHSVDNLFMDAGGYTLSGTGILNVSTDENIGASFRQNGGTHTIGGSLAIADYTLTAGTLAVQGDVGLFHLQQSNGKHTVGGNLLVAGHYQLDGGSLTTGSLDVTNDATFDQTSGTLRTGDLHVADNARMTIAAGADAVLRVNTLSLDPQGVLDLNDNDLVVENMPFTTVQQMVFAGYSSTADSNKTGLISTTGQTALGNPILALIDNALVASPDFPFGSGQTVSANAVIGKYTYFGDTNLDGQVTADDYGALDANFGATSVNPGVAWILGDTNFDGSVTADDYGALDANFGLGVPNPLSAQSTAHFVPEPTGISLLAAGIVFSAARRRRR